MKRSSSFVAITTEGGLLPADFLAELLSPKADIDGLTPTSYNLADGERISEQVNRSWNRLKGRWADFKKAIAVKSGHEFTTTETRNRWLQPLFQELGYGQRLTRAKPIEIDGKSYPVSHAWNHVPMHLVGAHIDLDHRTPGAVGAAKVSPHSLVQQLLNASDKHLWGIVSNGLSLRLLRDNIALTRQALVEWDLAAIFDGELYSEFFLLWLVVHQSRFDAELPEQSWLEQWKKKAEDKGLRALDKLRLGVTRAIEAVGEGLLSHPGNKALQLKLSKGDLTPQDFYRQVLRIIYRILFLLVAEDRELLHTPLPNDQDKDTVDQQLRARQRYGNFYSVGRLRHLTLVRAGTPHSDLWQTFQFISKKLGSNEGCPELALPALGSFLWDTSRSTRDLNDALISNHRLITAVHALAFVQDGSIRRFVDYKNLGSEELGSVYEGLLELQPKINSDAGTFELNTVAGNERKMSGSYYTPDSLVQCLLDSALDPVIADVTFGRRGEAAVNALLNLKICDPAAGSGHFLIAAAHRLAKHVAAARCGEDEPGPTFIRSALRDVIGRCVYGVDINPMAVELCKVSLWMEAVEPGKPLSFLDHHIQCGNSLLGTVPALISHGIPDDTFKPIEGDDPKLCTEYRKQNKREHKQETLLGFHEGSWEVLSDFAMNIAHLTSLPDDRLEHVQAKEQKYAELVISPDYEFANQLADAWCAAFVWKKCPSTAGGLAYPITNEVFRRLERNPRDAPEWLRDEIKRLAAQYQFFHWHLAFPEIFQVPHTSHPSDNGPSGWSGGFDVVLGNPPWEHTELKEKEWFANRRPEIANAPTGAKRKNLIDRLADEAPIVHQLFLEARRIHEGTSHLITNSGRFILCGRGRINTYAIFAELNRTLIAVTGRAGFIVQSDIATGDTYKDFFYELLEKRQLVSFYDFVNTEGLFPNIHRTHPHFCLITISGKRTDTPTDFVFWNTTPNDLNVTDRHFTLTAEEMALLNPNTRTCPVFRNTRDAELTKAIYRKVPVFLRVGPPEVNPWGAWVSRMFNGSDDSGLFRDPQSHLNALRLYESKFFWQFDHRFATTESGTVVTVTPQKKNDPSFTIQTQYSVIEEEIPEKFKRKIHPYSLAYRVISNTTNERTLIATILPKCGLINSANNIHRVRGSFAALLMANLNCVATDYVCRQSVGGANLHSYILHQLPIFPPEVYEGSMLWGSRATEPYRLDQWIVPRVLELTYTAWDLQDFAQDCGWSGPPFKWDEERRFLLRCELDAAFFHLHGLTRDDVAYILNSFPIIRRKDEEKFNGHYRTKGVILEIYDEMVAAITSGLPYNTRLDPPPANIGVANRPSYDLSPLVLPQGFRFPQADQNVYAMRVILSILNLSANKLEIATLMNACWLLAKPERLRTFARDVEQDIIAAWSRSFVDIFDPKLFLPTIDALIQRGELKLERDGEKFLVNRVGTMNIVTDPYVEFDASLALRVENSLSETERQSILPLVSSQELVARFKVA